MPEFTQPAQPNHNLQPVLFAAALCVSSASGVRAAGLVSEPSDEELFEQFTEGQRVSADELFRRYQAAAFGVAFRILRNHADAQDAVQEGFAKAITHLLKFQQRSSFKTWLLRVVARAAMNIGRKRERRDRLLQRLHRKQKHDALNRATDQRNPFQEALDREEEERALELHTAIRAILESHTSPEMLRVVELRFDGWTWRQIAEALGRCEKTIRNVRDRLRALVLRKLALRGESVR